MISGIFYIKNKITNEYYIGQSVNIDRIRKEYYNKLESNSHRNDNLQESYNRYGGDAFEFKIIKECSVEDLEDEKVEYIRLYDSLHNGFNYTPGYRDYKRFHLLRDCQVCRLKMIETVCNKNNSTGFYRVSKVKRNDVKVGYLYTYKIRVNGKVKLIQSSSLRVLQGKVQGQGFIWKILNSKLAYDNLKENMSDLSVIEEGI